ncbi:unnamed protein product [marine sediment metagenome]|uniref:Uncharacterized protein n=1 Tax=marine sediment metagenome TaxID=412755 RepID=X1BG89_9ZZZZ
MVAGADHGDAFKRDMGYSLREFLRILPSAVKGYTHRIDGSRVVIIGSEAGRQLTLDLKTLPERRIGMIRIPRIEVEFFFENFSERARKDFMLAFDRSYQRGGG